MGQYHTVYNLDKKEYFSLAGAKLWEKAHSPLHSMALNVLLANSNGRGGGDLSNPIHKGIDKPTKYSAWSNTAQGTVKYSKDAHDKIERALSAVSGRWAGCRILLQGDYAKEGDPAFQTEETLKDFSDITPKLVEAFRLILLVEGDTELLAKLEYEAKFRSIPFGREDTPQAKPRKTRKAGAK